jgi:polyribonucleotide nucleotidyltransferase
LHIYSIPFLEPVGGPGRLIDGEFIIDPSVAQRKRVRGLLVVGSRNAIVMVEGEGERLSENTSLDAISLP